MEQDFFDINHAGCRILADTRICGNIESDKDICLDGLIEGNVCSKKQVIVNVGGIVEGEVDCEMLFLNGKITGNVQVHQKAVLGASAVIEGGLITTCLEITPGARIVRGLKLKGTSK